MLRTQMTTRMTVMMIALFVALEGRTQPAKAAEKTVDEIVAEYVEAIGGIEAHKKHTTRRFEGMLTLVAANMPPWKMTITQKAPNLKHTRIDIPGHGMVTEICDGTAVWKSEPGKKTQRIQGGELAQKLRDARFHGYVDLKSDYQALTYGGQAEVNGTMYDLLNGTFEDGSKEVLYLDAQTHLLGGIRRPEPKITAEFGDYLEIDGVAVATSVTVRYETKVIMTLKIDKVTHNIDVNDALFTEPLGGNDGPPARGRRGGDRAGGKRFTEGGTLLYVQPLIHTLDTNGNVTIEEKELETAFLAILDQHNRSYGMLLKLFDGNADGTLGKEESQAAREFVFGLSEMLLHDGNRDWRIDDSEADKAWDQWSAAYERHNAEALERFDKDGNGELNPEEAKVGLEQIRKRK